MSSITLSLPEGRKVLTKEEAKGFLVRFENALEEAGKGATVETLDISCRAWKVETLEILEPFFQASVVPTIKCLNMDDVIASLDTATGLETIRYLCEVFKAAPHLERLDANDNALGARAGHIMRPLFSLPTLKELRLHNCGMSTEVGQQLIDTLLAGREETALTHLVLDRNQLGPEGAEKVAVILRASPKLEHFSYAGSRPMGDGTGALAAALASLAEASSNPLPFTHLDFADCTFGTAEDENGPIHSLIKALKKCPYLQTLNLGEACFGAQGTASVISATAASGAKLKKFGLDGVGLREDGIDDGVDALIEFLQTDACEDLEELLLSTNELEDDGVSKIVDALAKVNLKNLRVLHLEENEIDEVGAQALLDHKLHSLRTLLLKENSDIPEGLAHKLFRMYPHVELEEDLVPEEETGEDQDDEVDDLAGQLGEIL